MAEITINHVVSGSVTVDGTITGIINSGGGGSTPVLETLNVSVNPAQSQKITPGVGIDGYNEVKVPQAMAIAINSDFIIAMGGNAYDTIASKDYIAVYDTSGRNSTRFSKGSGGENDTLSELMFATANATATVDASKGAGASFRGIQRCNTLVIKNATSMASSCCRYWNCIHNVDIECPTISVSAFQDEPLETIILRNATSIGKQSFYSQNGTITDIYIYTPTMCSVGRNAFNNIMTATIHVPSNLLSSYQADSSWSAYASVTWVGDL